MQKNKKIIIILAAVILICIICLVIGILAIKSKKNNNEVEKNQIVSTEDLEKNFDSLFINKTEGDENSEIVFTKYKLEEKENGKYDINVKIPLIRIQTENATKINTEIKNTFVEKLKSVIRESTAYTIYNIDYAAYINDNILSIVIKAILKEGSNPQRLIIQTYNYDLEQNKVLTLDEILAKKNLDKQEVQDKVRNKITKLSSQNIELTNQLMEQGYNVFIRDIESEIYKLENTVTYFLGKDNYLYIIYAYGNNNFTNEKDIIVF